MQDDCELQTCLGLLYCSSHWRDSNSRLSVSVLQAEHSNCWTATAGDQGNDGGIINEKLPSLCMCVILGFDSLNFIHFQALCECLISKGKLIKLLIFVL